MKYLGFAQAESRAAPTARRREDAGEGELAGAEPGVREVHRDGVDAHWRLRLAAGDVELHRKLKSGARCTRAPTLRSAKKEGRNSSYVRWGWVQRVRLLFYGSEKKNFLFFS